MKIEIVIAARGCLDYDDERDAETEAYLEVYAEAVAEVVAKEYPAAAVEVTVDWRAPATGISIDGDLDINELDSAYETVRDILQYELISVTGEEVLKRLKRLERARVAGRLGSDSYLSSHLVEQARASVNQGPGEDHENC